MDNEYYYILDVLFIKKNGKTLVKLNKENIKTFINNIKSISLRYKYLEITDLYPKFIKEYKNIDKTQDLIWLLKIMLEKYKYIDYNKFYDISFGVQSDENNYFIKDIEVKTQENKIIINYKNEDLLLMLQILENFRNFIWKESNEEIHTIYMDSDKKEEFSCVKIEEFIKTNTITLYLVKESEYLPTCKFNGKEIIKPKTQTIYNK